jgi:hypothetical protein
VSSLRQPNPCRGILLLTIVSLTLTAPGVAASEKIIHSFISNPLGASPVGAPVADGFGNVYEVTPYGSAHGNGAVLKIRRRAAGPLDTNFLYSRLWRQN